ncbi:MAG TPA: hypothetical protein VNE41_04295 [Chitinophagaceae bacterium]|nr:hypothetical protein [Chitinophagaceae bacterium]
MESVKSTDAIEGRGENLISDQDNEAGEEGNVTPEEIKFLQRSEEETPGDEEAEARRTAALDDVDEDGEKLNEENLETDQWAEDMDFPEQTSDETDFSVSQT